MRRKLNQFEKCNFIETFSEKFKKKTTKGIRPKRATIRTSLPVLVRPPGMPIPNPLSLERELPLEVVDIHRRDDCIEYDRCLDLACAKGWRSFTCSHCLAYVSSNGADISAPLFPPDDLFIDPEHYDANLPCIDNNDIEK